MLLFLFPACLFCSLFCAGVVRAASPAAPVHVGPASPLEVKLWPGHAPGFRHQREEVTENRMIDTNAQGLNRSVSYVSEPTLFAFLPEKPAFDRTAIVIFPGGGYHRIVVDKEGMDVASWLNTQGIAGFVVKYRTAPEAAEARGPKADPEIRQAILADALQALRIVHLRAAEWGIDRKRIGIMGFSAGGHLCCLTASTIGDSTVGDEGPGGAMPPGPSFMVLIYAALGGEFDRVPCATFPPTFLVSTGDDSVAPASQSTRFYDSLRHAGVAAEMHVYARGGHGYGLGVRGGAVAQWPGAFRHWLEDRGMDR